MHWQAKIDCLFWECLPTTVSVLLLCCLKYILNVSLAGIVIMSVNDTGKYLSSQIISHLIVCNAGMYTILKGVPILSQY